MSDGGQLTIVFPGVAQRCQIVVTRTGCTEMHESSFQDRRRSFVPVDVTARRKYTDERLGKCLVVGGGSLQPTAFPNRIEYLKVFLDHRAVNILHCN